ncbi:MAG: MFS transporter [Chloroflexi bacterium]|nr:MFS transporter [Chloroflexota bacterium]
MRRPVSFQGSIGGYNVALQVACGEETRIARQHGHAREPAEVKVRRSRRLFYGWVIVGVTFLAYFVIASQTQVIGVLIEPMTRSTGWTKSQLIGAYSLASVIAGLAGPFIGPLLDRYGTRWPMALAAGVGGAVLLSVSQVTSLWQFYILYGVLFGLLRSALAELPVGTALANWFIKKRGRAFALTMTGLPAGGAALVPLVHFTISLYDWQAAWVLMAFLMWLFLALPAALFMRRRPEDMGLLPDGAEPTTDSPSAASSTVPSPATEEHSFTLREALHTRAFWLVLLAATLGTAMAGPVVSIFLVPYLMTKGLTPDAAARAYSVFALGWVAARFLWGYLAERFHVRYVFALYTFSIASATVLLMASPPSTGLTIPVLALLGLTMGGGGIAGNLIWPNYFGRRSIGAIRGVTTPFWAFGFALAPLLVAYLYDRSQTYQIGFALSVAANVMAGCILFLTRPPAPRPAAQARQESPGRAVQ